MTRKEQDRLWAVLPEEKKKTAREMYKQITKPLNPAKSNAQNEVAIMSFALETTYGTHNLNPKLTYKDVKTKKFWITRDKEGEVRLWKDKPTKGLNGRFHSGGLRGVFWECLFPEITFENSPQEIELKLIDNGNQD